MAVKVISFLGTGKYENCHYYLNDEQSVETPYIQEALIDLLEKQHVYFDEIYMLLTPEAKKIHWYGEGKLLSKLKRQQDTNKNRFAIVERDISSEQTMETIWGLFESITNIIEDNDHIIFDITHSYRYQPMLALLAIHFARVTKRIQIQGIYYGVYEPQAEKKVFPVIDLTDLVDLQDWITNVYAFSKTGRAEMITDWLSEKEKLIRKIERRTTVDLEGLKNLAKSWNELTSAIYTNRSPYLPGIANVALRNIENIKQVMLRPEFSPLNGLLSKLEEEIEPITNDDPVVSGLAAVEWCSNYGLLQQAYTMAAELVNTAVSLKHGYDPIQYNERIATIVAKAIKLHQKKKEKKQDYVLKEENVIIQELLKFPELLVILNGIKDFRNDINHAGWKVNSLSSEKFKDKFKKWLPDYKKYLLEYYKSNSILY